MRKYFSILVAVLLASLSFSLTSCGNDDDPDNGNGSLVINGHKYTTVGVIPDEGSGWDGEDGKIYIPFTYKESDGTIVPYFLSFEFKSASQIKVGDDVAKKSLKMSSLTYVDDLMTYVSGSMLVKSIDNGKNTIIVELKDLTFNNPYYDSEEDWIIPELNQTKYVLTGTVEADYNIPYKF